MSGSVVGVLLALLFWAIWHAGALDPLEWTALDARFIARFAWPKDPQAIRKAANVTIVAVDERAINAFGAWPWSRQLQGQIFSEILAQNPVVLGIDIVYSEPDARYDPAFAKVLHGDIPVVFASAIREGLLLYPRLELLAPNTFVGHTQLPVDSDGVLRRLPFVQNTAFGELLPFSWEVAVKGVSQLAERGLAHIPLPLSPADDNNEFLINYLHEGEAGLSLAALAETISAVDVIDGSGLDKLRNRIVLFGVTKRDEQDRGGQLTPIRPLGSVPDVYIHAAAITSILDGAYIKTVPGWLALLLFVVLSVGTGTASFTGNPWRGGALAAALIVLWGALALWLFLSHDVWLPFFPAVFAIASTYVAGIWYRHVQVENEARHTRATFERYVSPQVVKALLADPHLAQLHGGRRQLTVLFADIRGFTTFAERRTPEEVVQTLNRYLDLMTEAVLSGGGMVDKFVGDGMMAIFGAPLPTDEHARDAVQVGLRILELIQAADLDLPIGIGIHTGDAVVGSLGPYRRQEYTAVGDTVNVAARLQELALPGQMLISGETFALLDSSIAHLFHPLPPVQVRGRSELVQIYEFKLSDESTRAAGEPGFI